METRKHEREDPQSNPTQTPSARCRAPVSLVTAVLAFWFALSTGFSEAVVAQPIVIATEDFDGANPLQDWTLGGVANVWEVGRPTTGPREAHSGDACLATKLHQTYPNASQGSWIRWVSHDVPATAENIRLRFWQWRESSNDELHVRMRILGEQQWINLLARNFTFGSFTWTTNGLWTPTLLHIGREFRGFPLEFEFYFRTRAGGTNGAGVYLDDISLEYGEYEAAAPQDWESGFDGWHAPNGTWQFGEPTTGPDSAHSGVHCVATLLHRRIPEVIRGDLEPKILISPPFTVPAAGERPRLRFWHWFSNNNDEGTVSIRWTSNNVTERQVISEIFDLSTNDVWTPVTIDLSSFAGRTVELRFAIHQRAGGAATPGWYIDDIALETGPFTFGDGLVQGWENGFQDWSAPNGLWEYGEPDFGPGAAREGANCMATLLDGSVPGINENVEPKNLFSPPFTVPVDRPRLRFWHWFENGNDAGRVFAKKTATREWVQISETFDHSSNRLWTPVSIDLSRFAAEEIQLAFNMAEGAGGVAGAGWYIDDVAIESGPYDFKNPESWESGFAGWHAPNGLWEVGAPTLGPLEPPHGGQLVGTLLHATVPSINESAEPKRLISPPIHVATPQDSLSFWHWLSAGNDRARVYVRIHGDTQLTLVGGPYERATAGWEHAGPLDISRFVGNDIEILFDYEERAGGAAVAGWFIDLVQIGEVETSIGLLEDLSVTSQGASVGIAWSLSPAARHELATVHIERAVAAPGPYSPLPASTAVPATHMQHVDTNVEPERPYWYRLVLIDRDGTAHVSRSLSAMASGVPTSRPTLRVESSFGSEDAVRLRYRLSESELVDLRIFSARGQLVRILETSRERAAGEHLVRWDRRTGTGQPVSQGVYFVRLSTQRDRVARKVIVVHN